MFDQYRNTVEKYHENHIYIAKRFESIKIFCVKLIEIVILWVYYTISFSFSLFRHFWGITFQLFKKLPLAKDHWRGSVPVMRIWSILLMESNFKMVSTYI